MAVTLHQVGAMNTKDGGMERILYLAATREKSGCVFATPKTKGLGLSAKSFEDGGF
jgi:hypothetical protein